jgi:phenylalanine-4-hydroxylase
LDLLNLILFFLNNFIYFFSVGLLSSFGELQHALSSKPQIKAFEPETTVTQEYQGLKT